MGRAGLGSSVVSGRRRFRRPWLWVSGAAAVAVVVAALVASASFGDRSSGGEGTTGGTGQASASIGGFRIVAYQGEDVFGGKDIDFAALLGHGKPVILNFWAGLCPPCRQEMPGFQRVYDEHKDDLILVGVDVGPFTGLGLHDDARAFLREFRITYPTGFATTAAPLRQFGVRSMPTTVFFASDGSVAARHIGFLAEDELRARVADLLSKGR